MRELTTTLGPTEISMRELAPPLGYDFRPVEQARDRLDAYGESALRRQAGGGGVPLEEFFTD